MLGSHLSWEGPGSFTWPAVHLGTLCEVLLCSPHSWLSPGLPTATQPRQPQSVPLGVLCMQAPEALRAAPWPGPLWAPHASCFFPTLQAEGGLELPPALALGPPWRNRDGEGDLLWSLSS